MVMCRREFTRFLWVPHRSFECLWVPQADGVGCTFGFAREPPGLSGRRNNSGVPTGDDHRERRRRTTSTSTMDGELHAPGSQFINTYLLDDDSASFPSQAGMCPGSHSIPRPLR